MRYEEIANIIKGFGLPCAYYSFPKGTAMKGPYIVYYFPENDDLYADDINYQKIVSLRIELYADNKDFLLELNFEDYLTAHGLAYEKTELWIEDEHQIMIVYEMEVVING